MYELLQPSRKFIGAYINDLYLSKIPLSKSGILFFLDFLLEECFLLSVNVNIIMNSSIAKF